MAFRRWQDMASDAFGALDPARAVAVLPLAATEQHGPHLPTGTDQYIAEGLLAETARHAPAWLEAVVLPVVAIGASLEHTRFRGTLGLPATALIELVVGLGQSVAGAGLRKLVIVSSHGGNVAAMQAASLECRARHRLLAVTLTFQRLGLPDGIVEADEQAFGVHGGQVETALMLHFRPDLVDMTKAADFLSSQRGLTQSYDLLRAYGPIGFGWLAGDLNPAGVVGNSAAATAAQGAAIAAHQSKAFAALLAEVAAADIDAILASG